MDEVIKKKTVLDICDRWRRRTSEAHDRNGFYIADTIYTQVQEIVGAGPQGKWIIEKDVDGNTYGRCSVCGMKQYAGQLNYCPDCGSQMKELTNE